MPLRLAPQRASQGLGPPPNDPDALPLLSGWHPAPAPPSLTPRTWDLPHGASRSLGPPIKMGRPPSGPSPTFSKAAPSPTAELPQEAATPPLPGTGVPRPGIPLWAGFSAPPPPPMLSLGWNLLEVGITPPSHRPHHVSHLLPLRPLAASCQPPEGPLGCVSHLSLELCPLRRCPCPRNDLFSSP